jgi:ABC-2 type transport system permease protein
MKGLMAIFKIRMRQILSYRAAAIAGIGTQFFFGFVMVMIYESFYRSSQGESVNLPMTLQQTITYIWLGQGLLSLLPWNGDREIQGMIRTGDYAYELVRPVNMYFYWYARILAQRIGGTLIRAVPLFVGVNILFAKELHMQGPDSLVAFVFFIGFMLIAVLLGAAISNIITLMVLFTIGDGVDRLLPAVVTLFSGMVIPLSFFPEWSQPVFRFLPFSGLVDSPYKFYLGIYGIQEFGPIMLQQCLWLTALILLGLGLLGRASRRIIVQGG